MIKTKYVPHDDHPFSVPSGIVNFRSDKGVITKMLRIRFEVLSLKTGEVNKKIHKLS